VWRHAKCNGAHCPSAARHAANDKKIAGSEIFVFSTDIREADRAWLFQMGGRGAGRQAGRSAIFRFSPAAISAESPPPVV